MDAANTSSNQLLARLPAAERARFVKACVPVVLQYGHTIVQAGHKIAHVYLPTTGYVSILRPIDDDQIEVALAGHEGMFGWSLALDSGVSEMRALVQGQGDALRMTASAFKEQMGSSPALRTTIAGYTSVLMTQFAQTAGCNRFHVVEQRLARWLLMTSDRAQSNTFRITQEFLSTMLGVRRAGVSEAAGKLQDKALIRYKRGEIHIRDRAGLERVSCSCYRINAATYTRVLGEREGRNSGRKSIT